MIKPTESELGILQVLWEIGAATVREVNVALNEDNTKKTGYTTTLKLMQLMLEKGLLKRDTSARTHIYSTLVKESDVQQNLLDQFVNRAFRGSSAQLVMKALGQNRATEDELSEIKELIERIEKNKQ